MAGFLPGVDLADFLAGADFVVSVSEGLAGVSLGVDSTPVGVGVDGVLSAPVPVEAGVGVWSGAWSAPAFVGVESVVEVPFGVVAMRVLAIAGGRWGKRRNAVG